MAVTAISVSRLAPLNRTRLVTSVSLTNKQLTEPHSILKWQTDMQLELQAVMTVLIAEGEKPTCIHKTLFVNTKR
jgi:hypothetical protein